MYDPILLELTSIALPKSKALFSFSLRSAETSKKYLPSFITFIFNEASGLAIPSKAAATALPSLSSNLNLGSGKDPPFPTSPLTDI